MRYFSTFSGVGGFELGIIQAYENIARHELSKQKKILRKGRSDSPGLRKRRKQDAVCVGYSEINGPASSIYQKHFSDHKNYGDITKIKEKSLPDFDLLVGGFPCQAFSIAGKRGGFEDTRGTLFFDLARILKAKRPRYFIFENVKGLLSHDNGNTFKTIISTIDELGYDCQWQVLNSKNHGVPQNRERVFIVGYLRGTTRPKVFPIIGADKEDSVTGGFYEGNEGRLSQSPNGRKEVEHTGDSCDQERGQGALSEHEPYPNDGARQRIITRRPTYGDGKRGDNNPLVTGKGIRRLTPRECERLQGFPDDWTAGISDTQRYKCMGNAVTVNVIRDVIERIFI